MRNLNVLNFNKEMVQQRMHLLNEYLVFIVSCDEDDGTHIKPYLLSVAQVTLTLGLSHYSGQGQQNCTTLLSCCL